MKLAVFHKTAPMAGELRNGDAVYVRLTEDGPSLVCVIDALGHGPHAADVADTAIACLSAMPPELDATKVLTRLHESLRGSRGAAATAVVLRDGTLTAAGVGNVTLRSLGTNIPFVLSPGILGSRVHAFRGATAKLRACDRVVLHSDGIASVFSLDPLRGLETGAACARIFEERRKLTDDATVLVLDVLAE